MTAAGILLLSGFLFYFFLKPPTEPLDKLESMHSNYSEILYENGTNMQLATSNTQMKYVKHDRMTDQIRSYEGEIR